MAIKFAASASKHRISPDRARYVVENCACPLFPPDLDSGDEDLVVFLGLTTAASLWKSSLSSWRTGTSS